MLSHPNESQPQREPPLSPGSERGRPLEDAVHGGEVQAVVLGQHEAVLYRRQHVAHARVLEDNGALHLHHADEEYDMGSDQEISAYRSIQQEIYPCLQYSPSRHRPHHALRVSKLRQRRVRHAPFAYE
jgi:hypothetical protein